MSRDRYRAEEDWEDEEDGDDDYVEEKEYSKLQRQRTRGQHRTGRRGGWSCLFIGCLGGIVLTILLIAAVIFVASGTGSTQISHLLPALPVPGGSVGGSSSTSTYMQKSQQTLQLASIAQMQVHNQVGDISISVDPGVSAPTVMMVKKVQATSSADAQNEFGRISVQVQANSTTNTMVVSVILPDTSSDILSKDSDAVDVSITLPPGVVAGAGTSPSPTVGTNTSAGTSHVLSRAGAIPAPTLVLNADTSVGNVVIDGLNGVLVVKDSFGNVTVHNATLADGSHLETGTGNVDFDGTLNLTSTANPQPMFKIQAEKGNVDVTLPATTNVTLDANVNIGSIKSDFPITITNSAGSPSYYGPLMSDTTPAAVLVLDVSSGNIALHKD
jgi:hypothetical protein